MQVSVNTCVLEETQNMQFYISIMKPKLIAKRKVY